MAYEALDLATERWLQQHSVLRGSASQAAGALAEGELCLCHNADEQKAFDGESPKHIMTQTGSRGFRGVGALQCSQVLGGGGRGREGFCPCHATPGQQGEIAEAARSSDLSWVILACYQKKTLLAPGLLKCFPAFEKAT